LSLKIITCKPRRSAFRASEIAKSPGTEISAKFASGMALTAERTERGRQASPPPFAADDCSRMARASVRALSAASWLSARMPITRSPPSAASPVASRIPASAMIWRFDGEPIIIAASSTPSSATRDCDIRSSATESR
jgi:hypothetical protein